MIYSIYSDVTLAVEIISDVVKGEFEGPIIEIITRIITNKVSKCFNIAGGVSKLVDKVLNLDVKFINKITDKCANEIKMY
jgi:hypothetical protein